MSSTQTLSYFTKEYMGDGSKRLQFALKGSGHEISQWIILNETREVVIGMFLDGWYYVTRMTRRNFLTLLVTHSVAPFPLDPQDSSISFTPCRSEQVMKTEMGWRQ